MMRPSRSRILPRGARIGTLRMRFFSASQRVVVALHHLQPPQSVGEDQENAQDDVLHRRQADRRYFFVATEHQCVALTSRRKGSRVQSEKSQRDSCILALFGKKDWLLPGDGRTSPTSLRPGEILQS